jgi:hypothetical protein
MYQKLHDLAIRRRKATFTSNCNATGLFRWPDAPLRFQRQVTSWRCPADQPQMFG